MFWDTQQLDQDPFTVICVLLGNFPDLLGNFRFQTIIWPWKSLKPDDNFFALVFKIPKPLLNAKFDLWNFLKTAWWNLYVYMNMACKHFLWIFNEFSEILKEEIDNLIVKSFAGCYSGLILYLKTV